MTKKHVVVVLPTYNEKENIGEILKLLLSLENTIADSSLSILVVDDFSPDGTAAIVKKFERYFSNIHLIRGRKRGLGAAYIRGFTYALDKLNADIIVEMDADLSHHPRYLPGMVQKIFAGYDFIIGSRYIKGASIPKDWPLRRVLNSKVANFVARHIAKVSHAKDCTSGYRVIRAEVIRAIDLNRIGAAGYSFQINLLHRAVQNKAKILEVPIDFVDRKYGVSKLSLKDIVEFLKNAFVMRITDSLHFLPYTFVSLFIGMFILVVAFFLVSQQIWIKEILSYAILIMSFFMITQSIFTLSGMIYAWQEPGRTSRNRSPKRFFPAKYSFTALLPALREDKVIGRTIKALASIDYPEELKELLVICRSDDIATIEAVKTAISELGKRNIRLLIHPGMPRNKPDKLNYGLSLASKDIVGVFDAEDEPHKDIYRIINTIILTDKVDVVQSGVQLVNFRSRWFSTLNVLEYFFWFKSALHLFAKAGLVLLGGNSVFFKKEWLKRVNGWDADCLTEDADIGIRLAVAGAKIRIIYDELHATQEETPPTLAGFIRQRTRWNQGFMQIFKKGVWSRLPSWRQGLLAAFLLLWPEVQALTILYILISIIMVVSVKLPIVIALLSNVPLYILAIQVAILCAGLKDFAQKYGFRHPAWMPLKIIITFLPFQTILGISALRAVYRESINKNAWEKTDHTNAHRVPEPVPTEANATAVKQT